ncbi:Uncharacterised protein [Mycobacterium tuberculosis]|uniref:Uncharacterized protein n=1 Tax=Mycobacterium tuberculosis TaxID=1773 RepID=A0A655INC3_MYCTX|nr:Uncharacterised protein [Mycobacterium tuberculosis]CFE47085.1 Uncharacterised protein [Mycobacterium tuberculosis]CKR65551.1 Uncharacterised protein [Mycobacterium tuberculosis]CKR77417.1 Uncharacterised protein [Mycobacterium tuberculosis]CKU88113.1 Uncharacterised protein [Mycobacterium tuberculosis]
MDCGAVTTATTTSSMPRAVNSDCTAKAGNSTDAIAAEPAIVAISFDRRQMTRTPSSADSTPATTAAADSPIEWPITAPGRTPYAAIVAANATCIAKMVG